MSQHAACSPSSAAMWMTCPASITLTKDMVRPSSKYAREGTAAHKVAEMTLQGDIFLPDKVKVEGEEFIVSPGMCRALNPYITHVQGLMDPDADVFLEQRISVPFTKGLVWGTLDCGVHTAKGQLHIVDLKYGKGVKVDPFGPQLRLYALGLAEMLRMNLNSRQTSVTLTICQPRVEGPSIRSHTTQMWHLQDWLYYKVLPALDRIEAGDTSEHAGPHCRWCVRQTECKAFAQRHQNYAASAFDDGGLFA
jgi:Protein of unknown function (DUF2800)